jgi:ankyrin repeat protein
VIEYLLSVGTDPNALDSAGVAPLHRAVRTRSLPAVRALLDGGANPRLPNRLDRHRCISPFRQPVEEEAVLSTHASSRWASSACCWCAVQARPPKMDEVDR